MEEVQKRYGRGMEEVWKRYGRCIEETCHTCIINTFKSYYQPESNTNTTTSDTTTIINIC